MQPIIVLFIIIIPGQKIQKIDFTLHDCIFVAVKLSKNADKDKYGNSGFGLGFDTRFTVKW